jgi:carboxyl-terminal processing protease
VRVLEVPEGGAADLAGLMPQDQLVSVDGHPVAGLDQGQVHRLLTGEVGTHVELVVLREGEPVELRVERVPYEFARK